MPASSQPFQTARCASNRALTQNNEVKAGPFYATVFNNTRDHKAYRGHLERNEVDHYDQQLHRQNHKLPRGPAVYTRRWLPEKEPLLTKEKKEKEKEEKPPRDTQFIIVDKEKCAFPVVFHPVSVERCWDLFGQYVEMNGEYGSELRDIGWRIVGLNSEEKTFRIRGQTYYAYEKDEHLLVDTRKFPALRTNEVKYVERIENKIASGWVVRVTNILKPN
ncbi:hypothetical protein AMATHDRAFT_48545 [Amanita thiersii Skay4041]|uniref:Uncharacterized protein n=1 Tax=Amanita thiersii Skay4041 TaxID=703135 RepID=A0A2A9NPM4_9AGAR|nr:hypothetical protein AMATHDRAFT_48545 [Amanita thiersii Skay4041]